MSDKPENVYEAVNYVMQQVGYVQKEKAGGLQYTFAGEPALIRAIRPHMVKVGLFVYPSSMIELTADPFTSKHGSTINVSKLAAIYCFHHAPSDTKFFVSVIGKGMDTGDKDSNKAMTAAFKYALRQTLMIETGDDPDKTSSEEFEQDEKPEAEPKKKKSPPKTKKLTDTQIADYRSQAMTDPVTIGATQFWTVGHHFGIDEEQGKAIYKELGNWADALIHVIDKFTQVEETENAQR